MSIQFNKTTITPPSNRALPGKGSSGNPYATTGTTNIIKDKSLCGYKNWAIPIKMKL